MSDLRPDQTLALKLAAVRRAAPQEWEEMLGELRRYADARMAQCVAAPLDMLQVAQGRAQNAREMVNLFENAVKSADRITERRG